MLITYAALRRIVEVRYVKTHIRNRSLRGFDCFRPEVRCSTPYPSISLVRLALPRCYVNFPTPVNYGKAIVRSHHPVRSRRVGIWKIDTVVTFSGRQLQIAYAPMNDICALREIVHFLGGRHLQWWRWPSVLLSVLKIKIKHRGTNFIQLFYDFM